MAKGENQKLKLLYLKQILEKYTDEDHGITLAEITANLNKFDINADRKTLYSDFEELRSFGMDIEKEQNGRETHYKLLDRDFEVSELKMLVDSVQAAKFITEKKSNEIIKKLEDLCSTHEAKQLQRQVIISGRVKTMNETVMYNVDALNSAINQNRQISFKYYQWSVNKQLEPRHDGASYIVSPWNLIWDDEYYYVLAYDEKNCEMRHYRVDKMKKIEVTDAPRTGKDIYDGIDISAYSKSLFGMYAGELVQVQLQVENQASGIIIDRFGKDLFFVPQDDDHFTVKVNVSVSPQFFGWLSSMAPQIKLIGPAPVVEQVKDRVRDMSRMYLDR